MKEDLYATLFEETDVSDIKDWATEYPYFDIQVMRLTGDNTDDGLTASEHGFFRVTLNNCETSEYRHIGDFATLDDAEAAIADIQCETYTIQSCLNDRGRYCYTVWSTLLDISIKGALDKAGFEPDMETNKMRALLMGLGKHVQHETHGDLAARALFAASQFFNWLTTPDKAA